jgi:hypothetical protein
MFIDSGDPHRAPPGGQFLENALRVGMQKIAWDAFSRAIQ